MTPTFRDSDAILMHLDGLVGAVSDPYLRSQYVGFVAVTAVTSFEINIRAKLISFCTSKHKVFGAFSQATFEKTNARIKLDHLKNEYLKRFGDKYLKRFIMRVDDLDRASLRSGTGSIKQSYSNIVQWRHDFVHDGRLPAYADYDEAKQAYANGKLVVEAFFASLLR